MTTAYCGLPFVYPPTEVDVHNKVDEKNGVRYIGTASLLPDGKWRCLADVDGMLCLVEVKLRFEDSTEDKKS